MLAIVSLGLSALAAVALVAAHLALTDIWHGEADAALEWNVLRVAGVVIAASQLVAIGCAFRGLRARRA